MGPSIRTASSIQEKDTAWEHVVDWVLLEGDRRTVAACLVVAIVGIVGALVFAGVLAVGPNSSAATIFGSGLASGVVTLVTIALSINQLVLSRVFGSISTLTDRLDGARDLRQNVEALAGVPSSPNDPAGFLSMIATTLSDRASGLLAMSESTDWAPSTETTNALRDFVAYGKSIDAQLETNAKVTDVLGVVLGPEYAINMTAAHHLQNEYFASIPEEALAELRAIDELLEAIAVVRQFYKTIAIQQDFANLSRLIIYSGLIALLSAISLTLIYRTNSVTLPVSILPVVVSLGIGIIISPLALFVAYILRAATVARQTVSVGPFVPPRDR
jgi:hypothetical protein